MLIQSRGRRVFARTRSANVNLGATIVTDSQRLLEQAIEHQRGGRTEAAEWLYRAVLALDVDHAEANHNLGIIEIERGDLDAGLDHVRHALDQAPEIGGYWLTLVEGLLLAGRAAEAAEVMERARGLGLDSPEADALAQRITEAMAATPASTAAPLPSEPTMPASSAGNDSLLLTMDDGVRIHVPNDIDALPTYLLLEREDWPEPELALVRRLVEPDDLVLDLGAGLGVYTLAMAHAMGQGNGRVLALEPVTEAAALLARSLAENALETRVVLQQRAIGDGAGEVGIRVRRAARPHDLGDSFETRTVGALTLDELLADAAWPAGASPSLVRLDLAAEHLPAVLRAGERFFAAHDPLLMFRVAPDCDLGALRQAVETLGYALYRQVDALSALAPCGTAETLDARRRNLFACAPARAERLRARGLMV
ncbi:FkbM family methyltransferase [Marichromatium sp. AB32]|nr:FkbM family methyltransferase [Marichromatium sp. AB32]